MKKHIYESAIIGNCSFIAHINQNANIVWMCWPKFDSSPVFGSLLDPDAGSFTIKPDSEILNTHQYYLQNTNILKTEVTSSNGKYLVTDFAPRYYENELLKCPLILYRKIERLEGHPRITFSVLPKYNYGKESPKRVLLPDRVRYEFATVSLNLQSNISLHQIENGQPIHLNDTIYISLAQDIESKGELSSQLENDFHKTKKYWQNWVKRCTIPKFAQKEQIRSALCLKIHQFQDTGAIIASSTTSLPESPNSGRNWDYRYCWIRDSYYTLHALASLGHFEEMEKFSHYLGNLIPGPTGRYQPLYSITGEGKLDEEILDLDGYLNNKPVRIGNEAYTHIQNDAYGQILLSILPLYLDERIPEKFRFHNLNLVHKILDQISKTMDEPDAGLWEFRHLAQKHCYTFLFHWAGSKAALSIAISLKDAELQEKAEFLIQLATENIESCYSEKLECYVQARGNEQYDASLLQLVTLGYLDPHSEKAAKHVEAIERNLKTKEGFLYRYLHNDDFGIPETTFLVCTFWYIECLAEMNRMKEAIDLFQKVCEISNHVGLFSEDIDSKTGSQWGNFPQTYSHVGLVNAAHSIQKIIPKDHLW